MVTGYEPLIDAMPNEPGDRHVAAAAVACEAGIIVTINLKHFRALPEGLEAWHPDSFLCHLFELAPGAMTSIVREQAAALKRPPRTHADVINALSKVVPGFATMLSGT